MFPIRNKRNSNQKNIAIYYAKENIEDVLYL